MTKQKIIILAVVAVVAIVGVGILGYFSNDWFSPPPEEVVEHYGNVRGKVLTDSGAMTVAGIIVQDGTGATKRYTTNAYGGYDLQLQPGTYTLTFTKGYEFDTVAKQVTVEQLKTYYLQDVRLIQLFDAYTYDWVAGDLHQHTYYSDGSDSVTSLSFADISVGLYYAFLSDHNVARGLAEWYGTANLNVLTDETGVERMFNPCEAVEITTEFGHYQALGTATTLDKYDVELYEVERTSTDKDQIIMNRIRYIARCIKADGGVAQINHPYSVSTMGFNYWELANLFDTIEIWNGVFNPGDGRYESETGYQSQNYKSKIKWFELLNEGLYLAATGGTDIHDTSGPGNINNVEVINSQNYQEYYDNSGIYAGMPTTYLHLTEEINQNSILTAIKQGNSFISNGPVVLADVAGFVYGQTANVTGNVDINTNIFCRDGIQFIRVVKNGQTATEITLDGASTYTTPIGVDVQSGDWIVIEVFGEGAQYAITNPIFFQN